MRFRMLGTAAAVLLAVTNLTAGVKVENNDKIVFFGDSITAQGTQYKGGYANLVIDALQLNNIKAVKLPAGRNGNRSTHLLARLERDVIAHKPQILVLSCGVNDVTGRENGVPLEAYKKNMRSIVEKAQAAGIKVCIVTATLIRENPRNELSKTLKLYNDFLKELAQEKKCMLADANAGMIDALNLYKKQNPRPQGWQLTYDGIHMNARGNRIIAEAVLRALGLTDSEIGRATDLWSRQTAPIGNFSIPLAVWEKLSIHAADNNKKLHNYVNYLIKKDIAGK